MYDLVIHDGLVCDGTGAPWYRGDVAVVAESIVAIGQLAGRDAANEIDATGRIVAPGFVEEHSHSDVTLLVDPLAQSAIRQGITTTAVGQCGFSAAPIRPVAIEDYRRSTSVFAFDGYEWTWSSMGEYQEELRTAKPSVNVVTLAGHGALRASVMSVGDRPADRRELSEMCAMLEGALKEGARGFSTGLTYYPSVFADEAEITELARVLRRFGYSYHTHIRDYGPRLLQEVGEAVGIARDADVPLIVSHMEPTGRDNWGQAERAIELLEDARRSGIDAGYDVVPWTRGGGPVDQLFPPWARTGGIERTLETIRCPRSRARLARDIERGGEWPGWRRPEWGEWLVCRVGNAEHREWLGRSVLEISSERGRSPAETALLMFLEDAGRYWVAPQDKCDSDLDLLVSHRLGAIVGDGFSLAPDGPLAYQDRPNSYGTFPRLLGRYVRERGVLTLEQAVAKITSLPAHRLGLWDRGILRPSAKADITIFNPETVIECADYARPQEYPVGIEWVVVNGRISVGPQGHTGARAGQVVQ